jgi:hypothetical protein
MKKSFTFLSKCLFSILLTFTLVEIGLRIFPGLIPLHLLVLFNEDVRTEIAFRRELPTKKNSTLIERDDDGPELRIYKPFTKRTWLIKENGTSVTAVMDEMGFCNLPQNSYQLPTIDIIALGDSFTACHAVRPQDTWSSQLSIRTGTSVYNLGRIGIGIHEYIQLLKKFGLEKSPRIVIMNVYEGNDFRDARNYYTNVKNRLTQVEVESSTGLPYYLNSIYKFLGGNLLERHSYTANLILATGKYLYNSYFSVAETARIQVNFKYQLVFPDGVSIPFNPENVDTDEVRYAMYLTTLQADPEIFQVIEEALRTFVDLSKQYDFIPIVTYTPSAYSVYAKYVVFDDPKLKGLMQSFSYEQRQYLQLKGKELGYTFVDLTPSLQAAAQASGSQELLYYRYDLHLTPAGHAAIAEIISRTLQELKVVK